MTYTSLPPASNDEVARIMAEQRVGRRRAYEIIRRQKSALVDPSSISQGQRAAVLSALAADPANGKDAAILLDALHGAKVRIDMHDTVKTLWALQKIRHVSFRERGGRSLYAIKPTEDGLDWLASLTVNGHKELPPVAATEPPMGATVVNEQTTVSVTIAGIADIKDWPALYALKARAAKAEKISEAARLLEEAGEDEIALNLLGKTDFTDLEKEVIRLLSIMGDIK